MSGERARKFGGLWSLLKVEAANRRVSALHRLARVVLLATALVCGSALGTAAQTDPAKRFPHSQITADQWQIFLDEIKSRPGVQNVSRPGQPDILALAVPSENTLYFFTNGGPAHPAVVVEQVVQDGNGVSVRHTGYFAGSEQAFAKWFSTFHARDSAIREGTKSPR